MKKRFTIFYAIFASLFMLFSLGYCGYNLYKEYKQGDSRTASIFANSVYRLYTDLADLDDSTANNYQKIVHAAGNLSDYSYYEIKKGNEILFSYPLGTTQETTSSNFTKRYTSNLEVIDAGTFTVDCNIFLLRPYAIYYYSKIAFFLILGITLLTVILIIVDKRENPKSSDDNQQDVNDESGFTESVDDNSTLDKQEELAEDETNEQTSENDINNSNIEVIYNRDDINQEVENTTQEEVNEQDSEEISSKEVEKKTEPEGLFSTSSGLGWESYLSTRLENEINRAISSEMDISIFIIKITNLERSSELSIQICNYLADQFKFRDLLFEYKEDCIVAIENGADLDQALSLAEKLHDDIVKILSGTDSKCYMGISTRSIRMISASRFLKEADEALLHAQEDDSSPIIAFRADVEKYRKYMEQNYQD